MFKVQNISDYPLQKKTLNLPSGGQVELTISFIPLQNLWVFNEIKYNDFVVRNIAIVNNPNILRSFRNIIPFGIYVTCKGDRDPSFVEDFLSGEAEMYLLSEEECQQFEAVLSEP